MPNVSILKIMIKYIIPIALSGVVLSFAANGQVVTAPLDPTQPVIMPAAAAWRDAMIVAATYLEQTGSRTIDGEQIYQFDGSGYSGNAVFNMSNFFLDGFVSKVDTDAKIERYEPRGGIVNVGLNDNRLNLALAGNDFVTIGLGLRAIESKDHLDATSDSVKTNQTRTIGSISLKAMEKFYFGAGYQSVKETSDNAADLNWAGVIGGVGMKIGQPGETRFRIEYSYELSPEEENEVQGDLRESKHYKTAISRLGVELMFSGLLFSLNGRQTTVELDPTIYQTETIDKNLTSAKSEGGVLWIPEEGLILGFYFANEKIEYNYTDNRNEFRINIGYLF